MRIRDKTQCGNMSDEAIGESTKQDINHRSPNNKNHPSPNCSAEPEITPLLSGKIKVCRGLKNENNSHDGDKDGLSAPSSPNLCSDDPHTSGGGRLKFFKDGKFILELSHRKDGEKTCWIPVPKKTFWPVIGSPKQESLASLSDDNSSVQSSPWQRDHCWKQTAPKHDINKLKEFYFFGGKKCKSSVARIKSVRRNPFIHILSRDSLLETASSKSHNRMPLGRILQSLWERVMTTSCKPDLGIVSPRKRILRELERFTLEEATKRQRARAPLRSSHSISSILAKEGDSVLRTLLDHLPQRMPDLLRP
uniref:Protein hairless n=1 Tax=Lygus hesperus TaxID=30085 RepID=A0A0A9XNP8_LYGHE